MALRRKPETPRQKTAQRESEDWDWEKRRLSLHPLDPKEAIADILKVPPPPEKAKRGGGRGAAAPRVRSAAADPGAESS